MRRHGIAQGRVDPHGAMVMIQTFIYNPANLGEDEIIVSGSEARHIVKEIRPAKGDMVRLIDGRGTAHVCEVVANRAGKVVCRIIKTVKYGGESRLMLTLAIGLSSAAKIDTIIEKGTEVGVNRFVPLLTEKGTVKPGDKSSVVRGMNRWRRLCEAAAKQAGRSVIPVIADPLRFDDFIISCEPEETILLHAAGRVDDLCGRFASPQIQKAIVIIGPESGFSPGEIDLAQRKGICLFSLGERVLCTETAAMVVAAIVIYLVEGVKA